MNGSSNVGETKTRKKRSNLPKFSCKGCGKQYTFKRSGKKHEAVCLKRMINKYDCSICGQKFLQPHNLRRHQADMHSKRLTQHGVEVPLFFECNACGKKFSRKDNLKCHIDKCQTKVLEEDIFICAICGKTYPKKVSLKSHLRQKHPVVKAKFCVKCNALFKGRSRREDFAEHLKECSLDNKDARIKCVLCGASFATKRNVLLHMTGDAHKLTLNHENLRFSSEEEFEVWKASVEKATSTYFRNTGARSFRFSTESKFVCHRSGNRELEADDRQRRVRGAKKIDGFCPAEIVLDIRKEDGVCLVSYVSTHLGHNICDKTEIADEYSSKKERVSIESKIPTGLSFSQILTAFSKLDNAKSLIDSSLLSKSDLCTIKREYDAKEKKFVFHSKGKEEYLSEVMSLELFLDAHGDSAIFVKKLGKICDHPVRLSEKDSIVVIMTGQQKQMLKKYGHKVILVDGSFDLPDKEFLFMTLLVVDDYDEAIPVAFAVCNRPSDVFIDVFLTCVKNEIGTLNPDKLMSCPWPNFFDRWTKIVGHTQQRWFFKWHVNELWQSQLKAITNGQKRKELRRRLRELSTYVDLKIFRANLKDLLANTDPEFEGFLACFRDNFCKNVENWAYCYRKVSGLCTNVWSESFNRTLKQYYGSLENIKSMRDCLLVISHHLNTRECDTKKESRNKLDQKLEELRREHDKFLKEKPKVSVESNADLSWYLSVSYEGSPVEEIYLISKCEDTCHGCKLYCEVCDACMHQYQCTCGDNSIRNIMCCHIHALCMYLNLEEYEGRAQSIAVHFQEISDTEEYSLVSVEEISIDTN